MPRQSFTVLRAIALYLDTISGGLRDVIDGDKQKDLLNEVRSLLKQYPLKIQFNGFQTQRDLINNAIVVYDLLTFCKYKTTKTEIRELIQYELDTLDTDAHIQEIRKLYMRSLSGGMITARTSFRQAVALIEPKFSVVADRVQFYALAIPYKEKQFMHLRSAQGLPANMANEYEQDEIEEGKNYPAEESTPKEGLIQEVG